MQRFIGTIVSNSTKDTVKVEIPYSVRHPKYQKIMKRKTKLLVHNELPDLKVGDKVEILKSQPYSKMKHFKVAKKIV